MKKANEPNKTAVFDALGGLGVTTVSVEFDGSGDDGQIEDIAVESNGTPMSLPETTVTLTRARYEGEGLTTKSLSVTEAVEALCYDFLEQEHAGWEIDDGSYGTFEVDVAKRTIRLKLSQRFTDTIDYSHTF